MRSALTKIKDFFGEAAEYIIYEINWDFWGSLLVTYAFLKLIR